MVSHHQFNSMPAAELPGFTLIDKTCITYSRSTDASDGVREQLVIADANYRDGSLFVYVNVTTDGVTSFWRFLMDDVTLANLDYDGVDDWRVAWHVAAAFVRTHAGL